MQSKRPARMKGKGSFLPWYLRLHRGHANDLIVRRRWPSREYAPRQPSRFPAGKSASIKPGRPRQRRRNGGRGSLGFTGWGQSFDLVEIQCCASSSVAKSPTWESGPWPVITETNHRPLLVISERNLDLSVIPPICAPARSFASRKLCHNRHRGHRFPQTWTSQAGEPCAGVDR
jgi:hypothetical protein